MNDQYLLNFADVRLADIGVVGGKNGSLGEMMSGLSGAGIRVPGGFATTAQAYREFLAQNGLDARIVRMLKALNVEDVTALSKAGGEIRQWILAQPFPPGLEREIASAYEKLQRETVGEATVAVRSSAT